eukprot:9474273-Pyramimonas_sp.AAC.1
MSALASAVFRTAHSHLSSRSPTFLPSTSRTSRYAVAPIGRQRPVLVECVWVRNYIATVPEDFASDDRSVLKLFKIAKSYTNAPERIALFGKPTLYSEGVLLGPRTRLDGTTRIYRTAASSDVERVRVFRCLSDRRASSGEDTLLPSVNCFSQCRSVGSSSHT